MQRSKVVFRTLAVVALFGTAPLALGAATGHDGGSDMHGGEHDVVTHDSDHGGGGRGGMGGQGGGHEGSGRRLEDTLSRGGRPVWAQEGIPEVELGRLNMARAPAHVLMRALDEAVLRFDASTMAAFYSLDAAGAAYQLETAFAETLRIDSPKQNLALYYDTMMDYPEALLGFEPASRFDLAAIFLGSAADKAPEMVISADSVTAINAILGLAPLGDTESEALATLAETVRVGLAAGHGPEGDDH